MEIKNKTVSAAGNKQKKGSFFSALNAKRKKIITFITTALTMGIMTSVTAFAEAAGGNAGNAGGNAGNAGGNAGNAGGNVGNGEGEEMFNSVIGFFALWIGRIGLVVGFIGAIMFGLAIKNDDADAKTRGLMTMASGFVVFAITKALNLFGITG